MCSCAGVMLLDRGLRAQDPDEQTEHTDETIQELEWKIGFIQRRFAGMLDLIRDTTDTATQAIILEGMGRACAAEYTGQLEEFRGDLEGFIKHIEEQWAEKVDHNPEKRIITVTGRKQESCFCPFVNKEVTPAEFCKCSIGWQKECFEFITGKQVEATIKGTILQGEEQCSFQIQLGA